MARRVRRAFERLGPTFVKAGQLMSSSPGLFPDTWVDELARCRDDVRADSWRGVSNLIFSSSASAGATCSTWTRHRWRPARWLR